MKSIVAAAAFLLAATSAGLAGTDERSGSFSGLNGHTVTGAVTVIETADGWEIRLAEDFSFDGAPDPRVGFGRDGAFVDPTDFDRLRSNSGAYVYQVPDDIDPEAFNEVYIWCRRYTVPLAVAQIE